MGKSDDVDKLLAAYRELLLRANKTQNLVSRRDVDKLLPRLIEESLIPLRWAACRLESPLIDIGSGGGLPAIPLRIARPDLEIVMLESKRNKVQFLRRAIQELELQKIEAVQARCESFVQEAANQGRFRTVTARGVGRFQGLVEWAAALLAPGGELLVWTTDKSQPGDVGGFGRPDILEAGGWLFLWRAEKR